MKSHGPRTTSNGIGHISGRGCVGAYDLRENKKLGEKKKAQALRGGRK